MVETLPQFTKKDLRTLRGLVDELLQGDVAVDGSELFEPLVDTLKEHNIIVDRGYLARNPTALKQWHTHLPGLRGLLGAFEGAGARGIAYRLLRLMYGLLIADMSRRQIPLSPGSVITNLGRVPEVFDQSFPGYLASGLGCLIVKAIGGK